MLRRPRETWGRLQVFPPSAATFRPLWTRRKRCRCSRHNKLFFLENAEAIEEFADKKREDAVQQLESYLADPAPFTVLVLEAEHLDQRNETLQIAGGKNRWSSPLVLGDDLNQRNARCGCPLRVLLQKEQGVEFERGAAEDLAECVAADLQRLKTEIEKLSTFTGERKLIRREDVTLMVISERACKPFWEMADMIASRQGQTRPGFFLTGCSANGEETFANVGCHGLDVSQTGGSQ